MNISLRPVIFQLLTNYDLRILCVIAAVVLVVSCEIVKCL